MGSDEPYQVYIYTASGWVDFGHMFGQYGMINVRDYGSVGNGAADDTASINRAIAAAAEGQTLYFPAGTYKTTAGIVIDKSASMS